jgi:hypothetical protein
MARTALIVVVPEADEVVGELRMRHDWSAARGVPAHVTVLFPFVDSDDVDEHSLAEVLAAHPSFDFVLDRVERWDAGIVWLHPEPSRPFEELTAAVRRRWPDHPPYEGTVDVVIPHLTVSETPIEIDVELPIRSRASAVTLIEETPEGNWVTRQAFPLRPEPTIPQRLLRRLDDLAARVAERGGVISVLGLGSVGTDLGRLDDHSDLDFFVVVDDEAAQKRLLAELDWLEVAPVVYSFPNSIHGRKVLLDDGLYAEYAIYTPDDLRAGSFFGARVVWKRADAPDGLEHAGRPLPPSPYDTPEYQVGEALTNLFVGLQRDLRGERLAATRLIQTHAIDRVLTFLDLTGRAAVARQDPFAVERGAERRFPPELLPLTAMVPGYEHNAEAALAILEWLEARVEVSPILASAIRELAQRVGDSIESDPRSTFSSGSRPASAPGDATTA